MIDPARLTDLRFWEQIYCDARRTIVCTPADAPRFQAAADAAGMTGLITVLSNPIVPEGEAYVIDEQAIDAWCRQSATRVMGRP